MSSLLNTSIAEQQSQLQANQTNTSSAQGWQLLDVNIILTTVYLAIFIIGIVGNICNCLVIADSKNKYMKTATNYYLFSLSISDLLLLTFGLPHDIVNLWHPSPYLFNQFVCISRGWISEASTNASVLVIVAFTVERYLAICHPLKAHTLSRLSRSVKIIVLIWLVASSCALVVVMQYGLIVTEEQRNGKSVSLTQCTTVSRNERIFELSVFIFFIIPMAMITILYVKLGYHLRNKTFLKKQNQALRQQRHNHPNKSREFSLAGQANEASISGGGGGTERRPSLNGNSSSSTATTATTTSYHHHQAHAQGNSTTTTTADNKRPPPAIKSSASSNNNNLSAAVSLNNMMNPNDNDSPSAAAGVAATTTVVVVVDRVGRDADQLEAVQVLGRPDSFSGLSSRTNSITTTQNLSPITTTTAAAAAVAATTKEAADYDQRGNKNNKRLKWLILWPDISSCRNRLSSSLLLRSAAAPRKTSVATQKEGDFEATATDKSLVTGVVNQKSAKSASSFCLAAGETNRDNGSASVGDGDDNGQDESGPQQKQPQQTRGVKSGAVNLVSAPDLPVSATTTTNVTGARCRSADKDRPSPEEEEDYQRRHQLQLSHHRPSRRAIRAAASVSKDQDKSQVMTNSRGSPAATTAKRLSQKFTFDNYDASSNGCSVSVGAGDSLAAANDVSKGSTERPEEPFGCLTRQQTTSCFMTPRESAYHHHHQQHQSEILLNKLAAANGSHNNLQQQQPSAAAATATVQPFSNEISQSKQKQKQLQQRHKSLSRNSAVNNSANVQSVIKMLVYNQIALLKWRRTQLTARQYLPKICPSKTVSVVVMFFICWAPFHAQRLMAVYVTDPTPREIYIYDLLNHISGISYYISAIVNPILYSLFSVKFRQAFRDTFSRICCLRK